jgi:CPA2 family monovalent cation:H+ antiporter-2
LLTDLILVLMLAVGVVFVFNRLRQPTIVGLLITGVLAGPSGLRIIADPAAVDDLAEVGVVLLLFSIGLEMSLADLFRAGGTALAAGGLQVCGTALAAGWLAAHWGASIEGAVLVGMVTALSSTAVVTWLLLDSGQLEVPHGRWALAILILQDLCAIPMAAMVPLLSRGRLDVHAAAGALVRALAMVAVLVVLIRQVTPRLLEAIVRTRSSELFVLGTLVICLGTAWLGSLAGVPMSIGAFLAGLVLAGSPYSHHAVAQILPFRHAFNSLFFISVGMLVEAGFLWQHASAVAVLAAAVIALKAVGAALALVVAGAPASVAVAGGLCLAQIGEFSLVLVRLAQSAGLVSRADVGWLLSVAVATIILTPLLVRLAGPAGALAGRLAGAWRGGLAPAAAGLDHEDGHVIIAGFGINGANLARVLRSVGIPYVVLELNGTTVTRLAAAGEPIHYGDATSGETLIRLGIRRARELVLAISDPAASRRAVRLARELAPGVKIVARTRFVGEVEKLYECGADLVVTDEMEASLRLVSVVLAHCEVSSAVRMRLVDEIVRQHYGALLPDDGRPAADQVAFTVASLESRTVVLDASAYAAGRTLAALDLRNRTGATCLSVQRGQDVHANPSPDLAFAGMDRVVVFGDGASVRRAERLLCHGQTALPGEPEHPRRRATDRTVDDA